jgi:hypothetical protein
MIGLLKSYNSREEYDSECNGLSDNLLMRLLCAYLEMKSTTTFHVPSLKGKATAYFNFRIRKFTRAKTLGDQPDYVGHHPAPISFCSWQSHFRHGFHTCFVRIYSMDSLETRVRQNTAQSFPSVKSANSTRLGKVLPCVLGENDCAR